MKRINRQIVSSNLQEAREELEGLEKRIAKKDYPDEVGLQISLEHVYHHLNVAWNARKVETEEYANLTDADFNRWSRFPKEIEVYKVSAKGAKRK